MKKAAVVTAASRGIGRSIARRLARDGFAVVVSFSGDTREAEETVGEITAAGGQAVAIQADISDACDVQRLFQGALKEFERIDVVVNSAGILPLSSIARGDTEIFDKAIGINLRGTFLVLAQAARHISEGGRVILFSSNVLNRDFPSYGPFIASKAGVEGLTRVLANEIQGHQITVNAIAHGPIEADLFVEGKSEEEIAEIHRLARLARPGQTEEIVSMVSFLAGPDSGWVNGQVIRVDGGTPDRLAVAA